LEKKIFTSESVSQGHPDKICDQVSDAILDALLEQDPDSRVACETFTTTGLVVVGGEITTKAVVNYTDIVRSTLRDIGYTNADYGIDADSCGVMIALGTQSPDIAQGVTEAEGLHKEQGAGDQGMMFGFACDETPELMPMPVMLSHKLLEKLTKLRKTKKIKYLRPDAKSQVSIEYDENGKPVRVDTVVISTQHDPDVKHGQIKKDIKAMIESVIPARLLDKKTKYHINPTGKFVIGGPHGDAGLTGRKIIVDTYGGMGRHGGGAFSGKDPSKVDRSAAYLGRYIAKNIVAAKLAKRCEVQLAYAIGVAAPVSVLVDTFGTSKVEQAELTKAVREIFPLKPADLIDYLGLKNPIYRETAYHGHFGRKQFPWENTDKVADLKAYFSK
jgi:S-adenosylmethionine synthetase